MPTAVVPMPSEVRGLIRHHHQMERPRRDGSLTPGAYVLLARLIRLHGGDCHLGETAHAIRATVARSANTIITTSVRVFSCLRKGLNPTPRR